MYRQSAKPEADTVVFTCTTGASTRILGLLLASAAFVVGLGALTHAPTTMLASLPLLLTFLVLVAARGKIVVATRTLRSRRFFGTRTFPLDAVVRLVVPHASLGALAVAAEAHPVASLLLWDAQGAFFALPPQVPGEIVRDVVATTLPKALDRAEALIAAGGRYVDADGISGLDQTDLHGQAPELPAFAPHAAKLDAVVRVHDDGKVELSSGAAFRIAAQDLVLYELLRRRGVALDVPTALVPRR